LRSDATVITSMKSVAKPLGSRDGLGEMDWKKRQKQIEQLRAKHCSDRSLA
jgi:hypothetical protein